MPQDGQIFLLISTRRVVPNLVTPSSETAQGTLKGKGQIVFNYDHAKLYARHLSIMFSN